MANAAAEIHSKAAGGEWSVRGFFVRVALFCSCVALLAFVSGVCGEMDCTCDVNHQLQKLNNCTTPHRPPSPTPNNNILGNERLSELFLDLNAKQSVYMPMILSHVSYSLPFFVEPRGGSLSTGS